MQSTVTKPANKIFHNSSETKPWDIPWAYSKQDWFGTLPYDYGNKALDTIQQIYSKRNRYVRSGIQTIEGIRATVCVDSLLGIEKEMNYVPASTLSAIISQCSALVLWAALRGEVHDPTAIYNRLVEDELVGFKKERQVYRERIPLRKEIPVFVQTIRVIRFNGNLVISERINLGTYMNAEILGYAFLNQL